MEEKSNTYFFNSDLLVKYLCNEANENEKSVVETWLSQSGENMNQFEQLQKTLGGVDIYYKSLQFDNKKAFNKVKAKINQPQTKLTQSNRYVRLFHVSIYKYAAIILFAVLLGTAGYYFGLKNRTTEVYSEIISPQSLVVNEYVLPDGSVVSLNSNSKLEFPKKFKGKTREVTIEGEAFFDVKPNAEKPFVINAGNAQVKVVGTSFNVSAYPESETVEVVVKSGKVQVFSKQENTNNNVQQILLNPGEKGTFFNANRSLEKSENSDPNYLSWKTLDFVFRDAPLSDVFKCLGRSYHVNISVSDPELNNLKLNAKFDKKPIDFILNVVGLTFNLELSVENEQYIFSSRINK